MNLAFFGSGAFGIPTLAAVAARHTIIAVVTQPDRPAGRGAHPAPTPVAAWCASHLPRVSVQKFERIAEEPAIATLRALFADPAAGMLVIAFGQKLPPPLVDAVFAVNLHASLLPRWRGAAPINAAILAGDTHSGNSVITIADRMDAGLVLAQSRRDFPEPTTAGDLHDALAADGPALVLPVLDAPADFLRRAVLQDESKVTRAPKLSKADAWIDFHRPARQCRCRINGLSPWPGVTVSLHARPLRLLRAEEAGPSAAPAPPGTILSKELGLIACGDSSSLRLLQVQPSGSRVMSWRDFANGHAVQSGDPLDQGPPPC